MLACEDIRSKLTTLSDRKEEIRVQYDRLMEELRDIMEEERVLGKNLYTWSTLLR